MRHQLAAALRTARTAAGHTQEALAELLGVSLDTVQRAETARTRPADDVIASWMRICGSEMHVVVAVAS